MEESSPYISCMDTAYVRKSPPQKNNLINLIIIRNSILGTWNFLVIFFFLVCKANLFLNTPTSRSIIGSQGLLWVSWPLPRFCMISRLEHVWVEWSMQSLGRFWWVCLLLPRGTPLNFNIDTQHGSHIFHTIILGTYVSFRGCSVQGGPKQWLSMELSGEMMMPGMNVEAYRSYIHIYIYMEIDLQKVLFPKFTTIYSRPFYVFKPSSFLYTQTFHVWIPWTHDASDLHSIWNLRAEMVVEISGILGNLEKRSIP